MTAARAFRDLVTIGRVVKPQGRKGEVVIEPLSDRPGRFSELRGSSCPAPATGSPNGRSNAHWPHKGRVVLKLAGIDSIDEAERLRGMDVRIPEEDLAVLPQGSYYHHQLRGLRVEDESGAGDRRGGRHPEDRSGRRRAGGAGARGRVPPSPRVVVHQEGRPAGQAASWSPLRSSSMLRIDVLTIFPRMIAAPLDEGIVARARDSRARRDPGPRPPRLHRRPAPHRGRRAFRRRPGHGDEGRAVLPRQGRALPRRWGPTDAVVLLSPRGRRFDQRAAERYAAPRPPGPPLRPLRGRSTSGCATGSPPKS